MKQHYLALVSLGTWLFFIPPLLALPTNASPRLAERDSITLTAMSVPGPAGSVPALSGVFSVASPPVNGQPQEVQVLAAVCRSNGVAFLGPAYSRVAFLNGKLVGAWVLARGECGTLVLRVGTNRVELDGVSGAVEVQLRKQATAASSSIGLGTADKEIPLVSYFGPVPFEERQSGHQPVPLLTRIGFEAGVLTIEMQSPYGTSWLLTLDERLKPIGALAGGQRIYPRK
jgi:hypothetical protein